MVAGGMNPLVFFIGIVCFFAALIATFVMVGKGIGNPDNKADIQSSIGSILATNGVLCFIMAILSYIYVRANPDVLISFTVIMLFVAFYLSLSSLSVAVLNQVA